MSTDNFPIFATYTTCEIERDLFRRGILIEQWSQKYPFLFDDSNISDARNQAKLGYHYFEWLAAVLIYQNWGYLSLVQKYAQKKGSRQWLIMEKLLPENAIAMLAARKGLGTQCPDLLVYTPDISDCFFCEVKGPGDRLRPAQILFFDQLRQVTCKEIKVVRINFLKTSLSQ